MRTWISGMISTLSGALAAALGLLVADPQNFNFDAGLRKILIVCAFTGAVSLLNYLKQSPLPPSCEQKPPATARVIAYLLIPLFLLAPLTMNGCASNIRDVSQKYTESSAELKNFARISSADWLFGSGIIQGALNEQVVPTWIFDELKKVDAWFQNNKELSEWQMGYMVGLRIRMASPIIKAAIEQYAPGILNIAQVASVLAFIGL